MKTKPKKMTSIEEILNEYVLLIKDLDAVKHEIARAVRVDLKLSNDSCCVDYVGRLQKDAGIAIIAPMKKTLFRFYDKVIRELEKRDQEWKEKMVEVLGGVREDLFAGVKYGDLREGMEKRFIDGVIQEQINKLKQS